MKRVIDFKSEYFDYFLSKIDDFENFKQLNIPVQIYKSEKDFKLLIQNLPNLK